MRFPLQAQSSMLQAQISENLYRLFAISCRFDRYYP